VTAGHRRVGMPLDQPLHSPFGRRFTRMKPLRPPRGPNSNPQTLLFSLPTTEPRTS